jgi:hypothetical protein
MKMKLQELSDLYNVVNYVLCNEYNHFLECLDYDVTDSDISIEECIELALKDDGFLHIYKDAVNSKKVLDTISVD